MRPFVSVIMPVYNQEKYLAETIESVLSQSYQDFEFLILDDGSTDASARIIRNYAARDQRIIPFFQPNQGKCTATNFLVEKAVGKFCAFLDADDVMMPDRLEKQLNFHFSYPEIDASSSHCMFIDQNGKFLGYLKFPYLKSLSECREVLINNQIVMCAFTALMTTRKCFSQVGGLDPRFWPSEDLELMNRLLEKGFLLLNNPEVLMKYRIHPSSITAKKRWHTLENVSSYVKFIIKARRGNEKEISFEEFMAIRRKDSLEVKFHRKRIYYHRYFFREAGYSYHMGNFLPFSFKIFMAVILAPVSSFSRLRNQFKFINFY